MVVNIATRAMATLLWLITGSAGVADDHAFRLEWLFRLGPYYDV
jgi:hypothetical protein